MNSLRVQLTRPLLLGGLFLALVLAWYGYAVSRDALLNSSTRIAEARAGRVIGSLNLIFRSLFSSVQNIAEDSHVLGSLELDEPLDSTEALLASEWLESYVRIHEFYREILVLDKNGRCIASNNPVRLGSSMGHLPVIQGAQQGMVGFGEFILSPWSGRLSLSVAGPVDLGGQIIGSLLLLCDLPHLIHLSDMSGQGPQAVFTTVVEPAGQILTHRYGEIIPSEAAYPELYQKLVQVGKSGGRIEYEFRGRLYVGYGMVEPLSGLVVCSTGDKAEILDASYQYGLTAFLLCVLVLGSIYLFQVYLTTGWESGLKNLTAYATHVSRGRLDTELMGTDRRDALGELHSSLRKLVTSLGDKLTRTQARSALKSEFLANMSHQIRTPLNAILGMVHLSFRDMDPSPGQRENLEQIQLAARTVLNIVNDILDISKIESGKLVLDNAPFNLREQIHYSLTVHQISAATKQLRLEFLYSPTMPEHFYGDGARIGQVLSNLLSNAIKFTMEGGVQVEASSLSDMDESGRMTICISVRDTGIGIPAESLDRLLRPFANGDPNSLSGYQGLGLGLAISHSLVQMMGGVFTAESEYGKGSVFMFTLRLKVDEDALEHSNAQAPHASFSQLDLQGRHILIVEDDDITRMILSELIAPSGARISIARNGQEAVDMVDNESFDAVFMDMQMPVMGGLEATQTIRRQFGPEALPIIAVTANAMKEDVEKGLHVGMNDYITKPVEPDHLATILNKWLPCRKDDGKPLALEDFSGV